MECLACQNLNTVYLLLNKLYLIGTLLVLNEGQRADRSCKETSKYLSLQAASHLVYMDF